MKIIDNKKDYYDYLSGIYGIDDLIVYDRRGSISGRDIIEAHPGFFKKDIIEEFDGPLKGYISPTSELNEYYSYAKFTIVVEAGAEHYFIEVTRSRQHETDPIKISYNCFDPNEYWERKVRGGKYDLRWKTNWLEQRRKETTEKRYSDAPLSIRFFYDGAGDWRLRNGVYVFKNPILKDLPGISGCIPPEKIWQNIYDYISSTKEKVIIDNRTDIQHLESAGFDKKTSFRKDKAI